MIAAAAVAAGVALASRRTLPRTCAGAARPSLRPTPSRTARCTPCRASSGDSEAGVPRVLSLGEAYAVLGLGESATYELVLSTKNRLLEKSQDNFERRMEIEAAYDLIFSSQLQARLTGSLPVSTNVRFADVRRRPTAPAAANTATQKAQQLLQGLRGGGGGGRGGSGGGAAIRVQAPAPQTAATAGAVFGGLAVWTLAQGLLEPTLQAAAADVPGLQLALAIAATVYLLREQKRVGLGKAAGLALAGLVAGTLVGAGVQSWLRVDIIPLGRLASPGILVGEFGIAGLAAACLFLV